ncbi:MAG: alpha/beta fold hydrolase [Aeromicrobium sp.]
MTSTLSAPTPAHLGGSGTPIVLLHGVDMSWRAWAPVIPLLEKHHTVYVPTLAGHRGGPPLPAGSVGIGAIADALERQLDELGWQRAHFAGNSLGGWLSLEMAQRGRAESVIAFSPAGAFSSWWAARRLVWLLRVIGLIARLPGMERLLRFRAVRYALGRPVWHRPQQLDAAGALEVLHDLRACTALEVLIAGAKAEGPPSFSIADVPIRIAWARRDRLIPFRSYGRPYLELLPDAEGITLDGVGHVPMSDDPALVAETILAFTQPQSEPAEKAS